MQSLHPEDGRDVPAEDNARLIAAAPDLLAACQRAERWLDALNADMCERSAAEAGPLAEALRLAIHSATTPAKPTTKR